VVVVSVSEEPVDDPVDVREKDPEPELLPLEELPLEELPLEELPLDELLLKELPLEELLEDP